MSSRKIVELSLDLIVTNPEQPRKIFNESELEELKKSIIEYGVLQPIIVMKYDFGKYKLIAGERRVRACREAGIKKIPALVREFNSERAAVISIVENIQRQDLSFIEEAIAYQRIIVEYNMTQLQLSDKIGKTQSTISNKLRILTLPTDVLNIISENGLTERHARALLRLSDKEKQILVINKAVKSNLNVAQTEKLIDDIINRESVDRKKNKITKYISYKIYLNTIHNAFSQIKDIEENAELIEDDKGDFMEVKIIIPKKERCFT